MSRFNRIRESFRQKLGLEEKHDVAGAEGEGGAVEGEGSETTSTASSSENSLKEEHDVVQKERRLMRILHHARERFEERGLVGNIDVSAMIGFYTTSISCDFDATEAKEEPASGSGSSEEAATGSDEGEKEKLRRMEKMVLAAMEQALKGLERRALAYKTVTYADTITLSNGVYICLPMFSAFSISLTLSVSVISLFNSIAVREHTKLLQGGN